MVRDGRSEFACREQQAASNGEDARRPQRRLEAPRASAVASIQITSAAPAFAAGRMNPLAVLNRT